VSYANANFGVGVSIDGQANDGGRSDVANVGADIEVVEGSPFADAIDGSDADHRERFIGGLGNDVINGRGGDDVFHEGPSSSGRDDLNGGAGTDLVDYSQRTQGVLIDHDVSFDDGAPGENDRVDPNVNDIFGSQADDVITTTDGPNVIRSFAGTDQIRAGGGNDVLDAGTGRRHPVRLRVAEKIVGRVVITPRGKRISARGAVEVLTKRSRRKGRTVNARLALRLDDGLAGRTLKADVLATDTRGQRQLERGAGTIRVGR
jgi:hypothetical protein